MDYAFNRLQYVGTKEAFKATAPLLLLKTRIPYDDSGGSEETYTIGARFFLRLNKVIGNFPWNEAEHTRVEPGQPIHVVDEWYIENKLPADFLDRMYKWMIANVDNYKIIGQ